MRIQWPWISRRAHDELRRELEQTRLTLGVANSTVHHLTDRRMDHVKRLAKAAMKISTLERKNRELRGELSQHGSPV
jgi:chromosome segregation ATPase